MVIAEKREKKNKKDRTTLTHDCSTLHSPGTDDTLVEDGFNNCDIPQEIQESEK